VARGRSRAWVAVGAAAVALAGPAAGDPGRPDGEAGPPPAPPAVARWTLAVDGRPRTATVVGPAGPAGPADPAGRPLLVVLHGVGGRGADLRPLGFEEPALAAGAVVAYPDAWRGSWNDGRPGLEPEDPADVPDDVAFFRSLVAEAGRRAGVDPARVAVAGFSNGALMAARLACDAADAVVAVAPVAGTAGEGFEASCRPARPVAVVQVAGDADTIVPYDGGAVADAGGRRRGRVASAGAFVSWWAAAHGCRTLDWTALAGAAVPVARLDGTGCRTGGRVVHYRVGGGGHEWYRVAGFDTTAVAWAVLGPALAAG